MNKINAIIVAISLLLTACIPSTPNSGKRKAQSTKSSTPIQLELPAIKESDSIIRHTAYTASYNSPKRIPNWVAYELTPREARGTVPRPKNSPFIEDPDYSGFQPSRKDYANDQKWDKGHMAPCADMKLTEQIMRESFYFTNVCPQNHSMNAGIWQSLEERVHNMAAKYDITVFVICGPLITESKYGTLGPAKISIPDSFFKALLYKDTKGYHSIAFVIPNEPTTESIWSFAITVNDLELLSGIDCFTGLDKTIQEKIESQLIPTDWTFN